MLVFHPFLRIFQCTHCEFETLRFKTLNFHRRSKHNLSAMCCPQDKCTFKTILVERLRDHLIKKHEMERELAKESVAIMLVEGGEGVTCNLDDDLVKGCGKPKRMKTTRTTWPKGWKNTASLYFSSLFFRQSLVFDTTLLHKSTHL